MRIKVELNEATTVLEAQLTKYAEKVKASLDAFKAGKYDKAYKAFPYHDPVGENLEEYMNQSDVSIGH